MPSFKDIAISLDGIDHELVPLGFWRSKVGFWSLAQGGASGFADVLVKESGVLLLPAANYDYYHDYVRLGFGRKTFQEALVAFENFLIKNKPNLYH